MDSTLSLGEFEGYGVLVKVSIELVHGEGVNILLCLVLDILQDKGFFKGSTEFVKGYFCIRYEQIDELHVLSFGEGTCSSLGHFAEENYDDHLFVIIEFMVYLEIGFHHH